MRTSDINLEKRQCCVCGEKYEIGKIIIRKQVRYELGYCPKHKELIDDGFVIIVELSDNKQRTGKYLSMPGELFFKMFGKKDVEVAFCDIENFNKILFTLFGGNYE